MNRLCLPALLLLLSMVSRAQLSITPATLSFSQNFNTLDTIGLSSNLPFGWHLFESGTSIQVDQQYRASYGNNTAGNTYSYGRPDSADRALGALSSFTLAPRYGVLFVNNSGQEVTSAAIAFRGEMWRQGSITNIQPDTLQLYWSSAASSMSDTTAQWTQIDALVFLSPANAGAAGFRNGNVDSNNTDLAYILVFPTPVPMGDSIFFRWTDINTTASDDGLSIDDFTVSFTTAPPDVSPVLLSTNPPDNAASVPPGLGALTMTFDRGVSAGAGNIFLKNLSAGTTQTIAANSPQVAISGNAVTVNGISFNALTNYAVRMDSAAFDTVGYRIAGIYNDTTWNFFTDTGLMMVWTDPADNSTGVAAGLYNLRFALSDSVDFAGVGFIHLRNLTDGTAFVPPFFSISGDTVSFAAPLLPFKNYAVRIDANAFGNDSAGWLPAIINDTYWNFSTGNYTEDFSPVLLATNPADNATNVAPSLTTLQMTFDRGVSAGSGSIYLLNLTAGSTDTIAAQSAQVQVAGSVVTVLGISLDYGMSYAVRMDSMAFDTIGFYTAGIYNNTAWNFSTVPTPPDVSPALLVTTPPDNATNVGWSSNATLSIAFDRGVSAGTGAIHVLNLTDGSVQDIPAGSSDVSISPGLVIISGVELLPNKAYVVRIDSTAFDTAGYYFAGIYNNTTWNFFTEDTAAPGPNPYLSAFNPPDNSTGVSTGILPSVTFTHQVARGTGKVYIRDVTANQLIAFPAMSASLIVSGSTVTINYNLLPGHDYYILMDSTVFDTAGIHMSAIYDSTTWNFSTAQAAGILEAQGNAAFRMVIAGQGSSAETQLILSLAADAPVDVVIVDGVGRLLHQWQVAGKAGIGFYPLPVSMPPGLYYLQARSRLGEGRAKLVLAD